MKNILVILGHPDAGSFCGALADAYVAAAEAAGSQVRYTRLGELEFDPVLRHGYRIPQPLEPALQALQQDVLWAKHLVFVYPNWWGSMPALLKGFIDRVFLPGVTFQYRPDSFRQERLLAGRTAQLIVTMDTPPWYYRFVDRMPGHRLMRRCVLEFCGVRRVGVTSFGPVKGSTPAKQTAWLRQVAELAAKA